MNDMHRVNQKYALQWDGLQWQVLVPSPTKAKPDRMKPVGYHPRVEDALEAIYQRVLGEATQGQSGTLSDLRETARRVAQEFRKAIEGQALGVRVVPAT